MTTHHARARTLRRSQEAAMAHHYRYREERAAITSGSNASSSPVRRPKVPKWSDDETAYLMRCRSQKPEVSYDKIARALNRTTLACRLHRFHTDQKRAKAARRLAEQQRALQHRPQEEQGARVQSSSPSQPVQHVQQSLPPLQHMSIHPSQLPQQYYAQHSRPQLNSNAPDHTYWREQDQYHTQAAQQHQQHPAFQWTQPLPFHAYQAAPQFPSHGPTQSYSYADGQEYPEGRSTPAQHPADHLSLYSRFHGNPPPPPPPQQCQQPECQQYYQTSEHEQEEDRHDSTVAAPPRSNSMCLTKILNPEK